MWILRADGIACAEDASRSECFSAVHLECSQAAEHSMSSAANHVDAWYGTAIDVISQLTVQFRVITAIIGFTVGRQRRVGHNQRSVALVAWEGSVQQQGLLWKVLSSDACMKPKMHPAVLPHDVFLN